MLVKICGITRLEDAEASVEHGATALGFVFWPKSPRFIDPYRARAIVRSLPPFVTTVGVFVNQSEAEVNTTAALVHLGVVQLHGDETAEYLAGIRYPVLKSIAIDESTDAASLDRWPSRVALLLDVHDPVQRGGTGRSVDWDRAAAVAARRHAMLAGGLKPENVADAVARVRPFGIDVSSGVESSPGIKDRARLKALFEALQ
jgi:phosphoribosylanthranilate isomerase